MSLSILFISNSNVFTQYLSDTRIDYIKTESNIISESNSVLLSFKNENIKLNPVKHSGIQLKSKPELILSLSVSGLLPIAELKGNTADISLTNPATSAKSYYELWGYSIGLTAKLPAGKTGNLRPKISLHYTGFFNSGNDSTGMISIEPQLNIIQVGLGAEYSLLLPGSIRPFIEAEATANIFNGSVSYTDITGINNYTEDFNRNVRYGFTAGAGAEYVFNKTYSIFAGLRFSMANLVGKEYDETGAHDLNDEAFNLNGFAINRKNISFLSLYAGVSFGIGN